MFNPFQQDSSCEPSVDQFDSSLPICFADPDNFVQRTKAISELSTPIAIIDIDRLSQKFSCTEVTELELRNSLRQVQQMLRQLKSYSESLEQRNLEVVLELQKQRMKNKQLLNTLTFIRNSEEERNKALQEKISAYNDLSSKTILQKNRGEILQNEVKTLRLENNYLKELILMANENYEKLEERNKQLGQHCTSMEEERSRREIDMLKKTEEIKSMFATIVIEKNQADRPQRKEELNNTSGTINFNSLKSVRKEPVEDAYRQIFMKTLKVKKQNKP